MAAFRLKPGEVSDIVETEDGFHLIQMIERRGEYIDVRHILIQPKVSPAELNRAKLFLDSVAGLVAQKKLSFTEAVQKFSDDPSKNNNGMMINPQTGDTKFMMNQVDPKVFFVIDKLKEGEISTATKWEERGRTQFRAYYLLSRTQPHKADLEQDYAYIQNEALARKKMEAIVRWVDDKVKSTYIYISDPYTDCDFDRPWIPRKKINPDR